MTPPRPYPPPPGPQYGPQHGPPAGTAALGHAGPGVTDWFGPRLRRRAEPGLGSSLGGLAAVLVLVGGLVWSVGYAITGTHVAVGSDGESPVTHGTSHRYLGFGLFLACALLGYAVLITRRRGPLATTGAVASAFAVPLAMLFVSFDLGDIFRGGPPFSIDAVYAVSIVVWLVSYFAVPGARGRPFYLGIAGTSLAAYLALKAAGTGSVLRSASESVSSRGLSGGTGTVAAIGLIFGLAYYAIAAGLDRNGNHGAATGMAYAGFFTTVGGVVAAAPDFEIVGTGILLIVLGVVLGWYGSRFGRRFTAWAWAAGVLVGVALVVAKAFPHSYKGAGITLIVVGVVVAVGAQLVGAAAREAPEVTG